MSDKLANAKNFSDILNDYQFFVDHSDEALRNREAVSRVLLNRPMPHSVLDFGCGKGEFLASLFDSGPLSRAVPQVHLVEPSIHYRDDAERRLSQLLANRVTSSERLDSSHPKRFDLILANHVLYYVPDLHALLGEWFRASHQSTRIVVTLANERNALVSICEQAFSLRDEPAPFQSATLLREVLDRLGTPFKRSPVRSDLKFVDTPENRAKILRFVLGPYVNLFRELPHFLLDPFRIDGQIHMELWDDIFEIQPVFLVGAGRRKGDLSAA